MDYSGFHGDNPFGHFWYWADPFDIPNRKFTSHDYRRCGNVWCPIRFISPKHIEVINDPKSEEEIRQMQAQERLDEYEFLSFIFSRK